MRARAFSFELNGGFVKGSRALPPVRTSGRTLSGAVSGPGPAKQVARWLGIFEWSEVGWPVPVQSNALTARTGRMNWIVEPLSPARACSLSIERSQTGRYMREFYGVATSRDPWSLLPALRP